MIIRLVNHITSYCMKILPVIWVNLSQIQESGCGNGGDVPF